MAYHSKFCYYDSSALDFVEEAEILKLKFTDVIGGEVSSLEITISDPTNIKKDNFHDYQKVQLFERETGKPVFQGKIESREPIYDEQYGRCIELLCKNYLQKFKEREIRTNLVTSLGDCRRSSLIKDILNPDLGYNFPWITQDSIKIPELRFEVDDSSVEEVLPISRSFIASPMTVMDALVDLASEDPWDGTPTGIGYDFYQDNLLEDSAWHPRFRYFKRGKYPEGGPLNNGLVLKYGKIEAGDDPNRTRLILHDYSFPEVAKEIITRVIVEYTQVLEDDTEVLARVLRPATAQEYPAFVATNYEDNLGFVKLKILHMPEIKSADDAIAKADAYLKQSSEEPIQRGKVSIIGYPYYYISPEYFLAQAGHLVRIKVAPLEMNKDFLVLGITYTEPECKSELELIEVNKSYGRLPYDFASQIATSRKQERENSWLHPTNIGETKLDNISGWIQANVDELIIAKTDFLPTGAPYIYFEVRVPRVLRASEYTVKYRASDSAEWETLTVPQPPSTESYAKVNTPMVIGGKVYYFMARAKGMGAVSDWTTAIEKTAALDETPPGPPTDIHLTSTWSVIFLEWTNPQDLDFLDVEIWRNTENVAPPAGGKTLGRHRGTFYSDSSLETGIEYWYWLRAFDASGNHSDWVAAGSIVSGQVSIGELTEGLKRPLGQEWLGCFYEAEELNGDSTIIDDATASGGKCRRRLASEGFAWVTSGPYKHLPGQNYLLGYRLKVSDNTSESRVASIRIGVLRDGSWQYPANMCRYLNANEFNEANVWQSFSLMAEIRENDEQFQLITEFYSDSGADLYVDSIRAISFLLVGTAVIEDLAVTTAKIAKLAVGEAQINNLAVTDAKIKDLKVDKLLAGNLQVVWDIVAGGKIKLDNGRLELGPNGVKATSTEFDQSVIYQSTEPEVSCSGTEYYSKGEYWTINVKAESLSDTTEFQFIVWFWDSEDHNIIYEYDVHFYRQGCSFTVYTGPTSGSHTPCLSWHILTFSGGSDKYTVTRTRIKLL